MIRIDSINIINKYFLGVDIMNLDAVEIFRKTWEEWFHTDGAHSGIKLNDFWSWSSSDILNNALRGVIAEFIVASDLKIAENCRTEWDAYDLLTDDGIKVEVKSAAYLQSWKQKNYSSISFDIRQTKGWNSETNEYDDQSRRQSDVYVFCLLSHKDKATVDPLNLGQWEFYVLATKILNEKLKSQKSVSLSSLLKLEPTKVEYGRLRKSIDYELSK